MVEPRQAQTLREAYAVLDPLRPLSGGWMDAFYVERPRESSVAGLSVELAADPSHDDKTLFTGTRGSGKTTELYRLAANLSANHLVVFMQVAELLNLGDVQYTDLLVLLGLEVSRAAQEAGWPQQEEGLSDLLFWYREHLREEILERPEIEAGVEVNAWIARVSGRIRTNAPTRETIRATARANLATLLERVNGVLRPLRERLGRRILVIVDGLDRVYDEAQVRSLFLQAGNALLEPECRIIYTVPFALCYSNDFQQVRHTYTRFYELPNVRTHAPNGSVHKSGARMLQGALYRRVAPKLLTREATRRLISYSGGLMRELIYLGRSSLTHALTSHGEQGPIQVDDVEYAAQQMRNSFRGILGRAHYDELARILRGERFVNNETALQLIHNLSLLKYDGEGAWWRVNPLVEPLVQEWIDEGQRT